MSLIRRKENRKKVVKEEVQKGPGHLISLVGVEQDSEMWNRGRMLNENVLEKDCGVGYHVHQGDGEIYVILSGEAEYNDNGTITTVTCLNKNVYFIHKHKLSPLCFRFFV